VALFRALDKKLHVELFLVGILREDTADRHPVCPEPEDEECLNAYPYTI
jgi:hypothetical protein